MRITHLVALACLLAAPAHAQPLRIAVQGDTTSIDPHFQDIGPNVALRQHIFDALVRTGPNSEILPGLAESWRMTDNPLVWEITLRAGVRFHDGSPVTAEDVAFSLRRAPQVPNAPATVGRYLQDLTDIVVVDGRTLRISTREPSPILPNNLAAIAIVPARIGLAAEPRDFNSGALAIGTGPFRFVEWVPGSHVRLAANSAHWAGAPPWSEVTIRPIANNGARVASLLAGDVDVIAAVPPLDVPRLRREQRLAVWEGVSNRVVFWTMDIGRAQTPHVTGKDGTAIANPFRDRRVREAVMLALDRRAIVDRVMEGLAVPATQLVPPGMPGHDPAIALPSTDLARARALMAEAGLPNGFRLLLHSTTGRYPNDQRQAETIAQMLARIGIEAQVQTMPLAVYFNEARRFAFSFNLVSWGFTTGDTYVILREALRSDSGNNYGRYAHPAVDAALDAARTEMNPARRAELLAAAQRQAAADIAYVPTHFQVNVWAGRADLAMPPRMDEATLAHEIRRR